MEDTPQGIPGKNISEAESIRKGDWLYELVNEGHAFESFVRL